MPIQICAEYYEERIDFQYSTCDAILRRRLASTAVFAKQFQEHCGNNRNCEDNFFVDTPR